MSKIRRMRMVAGPNGSGKSTLIHLLQRSISLGIYINADDIEAGLSKKPVLHFEDYAINTNQKSFSSFLKRKQTFGSPDFKISVAASHSLENNILVVSKKIVSSYLASVIADFMRHELLKTGTDFSYETVMSHKTKIDFLKLANRSYRTYLYFIATNNPIINIERVKARVLKGGHPVSDEKLLERYKRSIDLLDFGLKHAYRTFVFDNTTSLNLVAEYKEGSLVYRGDTLAKWHSPKN